MTARYRILLAAERDIRAIAEYWNGVSPKASLALQDDMAAAIEMLASTPGMGSKRSDLTSLPVRFWPMRGRYLIVYAEVAGGIDVVRVFGAAQDVAKLLD